MKCYKKNIPVVVAALFIQTALAAQEGSTQADNATSLELERIGVNSILPERLESVPGEWPGCLSQVSSGAACWLSRGTGW